MAYIVNRFRTSEEEIGHRYDSFKFDSQDLHLYHNISPRSMHQRDLHSLVCGASESRNKQPTKTVGMVQKPRKTCTESYHEKKLQVNQIQQRQLLLHLFHFYMSWEMIDNNKLYLIIHSTSARLEISIKYISTTRRLCIERLASVEFNRIL